VPSHDSSDAPAPFPTTKWARIQAVQDRNHPEHGPELNRFVALYWKPVFYFLRTRGLPFHEAQDVTQDFFLRLQEQDVVARADPQRGRFRSFLLGVLKRVLADRGRRAGGDRRSVSFDSLIGDEERSFEPAAGDDPEMVFERRWARDLWDRTLRQLADKYTGDRAAWGEMFLAYFGPEGKRPSQEALAERFGLSRDQVREILPRVSKRFDGLLRAELRDEGVPEAEIDEEILRLGRLLGRPADD
jgi:RNA polymerase sigma-70 factor (ECF subfamily)